MLTEHSKKKEIKICHLSILFTEKSLCLCEFYHFLTSVNCCSRNLCKNLIFLFICGANVTFPLKFISFFFSFWLDILLILLPLCLFIYLFIYLGFYVAFNTVQVISRRVVGRAEETSTWSSLGLCTVNCRPTASNYQLSHLRP